MNSFSKGKFLNKEEELIKTINGEYKPNIHEVTGVPILIFWEIEEKKYRREISFTEIWRFKAQPKRDKILIDEKLMILDPQKASLRYAKQSPIWFATEIPLEISIPIITINFLDFRIIKYEQSISFGVLKEIQNRILQDIMNQIIIKIEQETKRVFKEVDNESRS